jgi:hypothetical protein
LAGLDRRADYRGWMAATKVVEFHVDGDAARAKATVVQALEARKFKLKWTDEWTGTAERGNKVLNVLLGALAQYFKVDLAVMTAPEGHGVIRVQKSSSGWTGGAIGARRTTKNFEGLRGELEATFAQAGVLKDVVAS